MITADIEHRLNHFKDTPEGREKRKVAILDFPNLLSFCTDDYVSQIVIPIHPFEFRRGQNKKVPFFGDVPLMCVSG